MDCFGLFASDAVIAFFRKRFGADFAPIKDRFCAGGDSGEISFSEFLKSLADAFNMPLEEVRKEIKESLVINPEMFALAKAMREKHEVRLLSNCMEGALEFFLEDQGFDECFDRQYRSYELHLIKPSKEIYEYVLNDLGDQFEQVVFYDDNPVNVKSAAEAGIPSVLFTTVSACALDLASRGY